MEQSTPLSEAQKVALDKLATAVGSKYVEFLAAQGTDVLNARVETFMQYETVSSWAGLKPSSVGYANTLCGNAIRRG